MKTEKQIKNQILVITELINDIEKSLKNKEWEERIELIENINRLREKKITLEWVLKKNQ